MSNEHHNNSSSEAAISVQCRKDLKGCLISDHQQHRPQKLHCYLSHIVSILWSQCSPVCTNSTTCTTSTTRVLTHIKDKVPSSCIRTWVSTTHSFLLAMRCNSSSNDVALSLLSSDPHCVHWNKLQGFSLPSRRETLFFKQWDSLDQRLLCHKPTHAAKRRDRKRHWQKEPRILCFFLFSNMDPLNTLQRWAVSPSI